MVCFPKISIIIPIFNAENTLEECLDSIIEQEFTDYEVIMVNDGSTDHSSDICEEYCRKDSRFTLINEQNKGVAEARNNGLANSKGRYVTFMDSDDWVDKKWLEAYSRMMQEADCDLMVQGVVSDWGLSQQEVSAQKAICLGRDILNGFMLLSKQGIEGFVHNKMYKREIIQAQNLDFHYSLHEDTLFNWKYLKYTSSLGVIPEAHYHYMQRGGDSLVNRRYPFAEMYGLITSLREARLELPIRYNHTDYINAAWADYLVVYTVLLVSLYDKKRGISSRSERIKILKAYQLERKNNRHLELKIPTFAKSFLAAIALLNPYLFDWFFSLVGWLRKSLLHEKKN